MFSSKEYINKQSEKSGRRGRFDYLQSLVTEFQDTENVDSKLQVLANLGNFAYDPINYEYLRELNVVDLFIGKSIFFFLGILRKKKVCTMILGFSKFLSFHTRISKLPKSKRVKVLT